MDVRQFLVTEWRQPFVWGVTDCASTADRWFKLVRGFSPLERYGRPIRDEENVQAWLNEPGGLLWGMRRVMLSAGVTRVRGAPSAGDIGIVIVDNRACIAIFDGDTWCSRDTDGVIVADDCHRYVAWELTCRKLLAL